MARVTVEDCLEVVDNQYDLVILAKERTLQIELLRLCILYRPNYFLSDDRYDV